MARKDGRVDVRAYQILDAAGKMVGTPVVKRKLDYCTAYEVVMRDDASGKVTHAYRIVEATIRDGKILAAETAQACYELKLNQVTELIANYKRFHSATVAEKNETPSERWNGVLELQFRADGDLDMDEVYDALWISSNHIEQRDGGLYIKLPKGMSFVKANLPPDNVFIPE